MVVLRSFKLVSKKKLSKDIECVQKCCLKLLFPGFSSTELLSKCGLERLDDRRDMITQSMFRQRSKTPLTLSVTSCQSVSQSDGSAAYISISNPTSQNFTSRKGLCTVLYFQEVLIMLHNLHVLICFILEYLVVTLIGFVLLV